MPVPVFVSTGVGVDTEGIASLRLISDISQHLVHSIIPPGLVIARMKVIWLAFADVLGRRGHGLEVYQLKVLVCLVLAVTKSRHNVTSISKMLSDFLRRRIQVGSP